MSNKKSVFLFQQIGEELGETAQEQVSGAVWVEWSSGSFHECTPDGTRCVTRELTDRYWID